MKKWGIVLFFAGIMGIFLLIPTESYATENNYGGIESAPYSNENMTIDEGEYSTYLTEGLTEEEFWAVFGRAYFEGNTDVLKGSRNYLYSAIDPSKSAENGWTLIHTNDVEAWIAYYGRTNNSQYTSYIKSRLQPVTVQVGFTPVTFYNHAEVAQVAGGQPGTFSLSPLRNEAGQIIDENQNGKPDFYKAVIRNIQRYDDTFKHSINLKVPSSVKVGQPVTIDLETTDGSFYILRGQRWTVTINGSTRLMNYEDVPLASHAAKRSISHTFNQPGTYTIKFEIEDASFHSDARTGTTNYSVSKTITVQPADEPLGPIAEFSWIPTHPIVGDNVFLTDLSTHPEGIPIVSWSWRVDGQFFSNDQHPTRVFTSARTYNVQLTVTDANGKSDSVQYPITVSAAKPLIPPNACINAPKTINAGDMASISSCSWDDDGEIVGLDWNWTGKSDRVAGNLEQDANSGFLIFMQPGEYAVQLRVTDNDGLTDWEEVIIEVMPPYPIAIITVEGTQKENRRVTLDASRSFGTMYYPVDTSKTTWEITPLDGQDVANIKVRGGSLNGHRKDVLFKETGQYQVLLTVYNTYGNMGQMVQTLTIEEDVPPVARFTITPGTSYRDPLNDKKAIFTLRDVSYSIDDDFIQQRIWSYAFDSQNDGSYENDNWIIIDDQNRSTIELEVTQGVGRYYFSLEVIEGFGQDTLLEFITPDDYRRDKD